MKKIIILFLIGISAFGQVKVVSKEGKAIEVNSPATTTSQGIVKLAGDLGGTADAPTVPSLNTKAPLASPTFTGVITGDAANFNTIKSNYIVSDNIPTSLTATEMLVINPTTKAVEKKSVPASSSVSVVRKTSNYTLSLSDSIVLCDASTGGLTLSFPPASSTLNKIYTISKIDETENLLNFSPAIQVTASTTAGSLNFAKTIKVVSDGTTWYLID